MNTITFDHNAGTVTACLGLAEGEAERQLTLLAKECDKFQEENGGLKRSQIAELMVKHVSKEVILVLAVEDFLSTIQDSPMEKLMKMMGKLGADVEK